MRQVNAKESFFLLNLEVHVPLNAVTGRAHFLVNDAQLIRALACDGCLLRGPFGTVGSDSTHRLSE